MNMKHMKHFNKILLAAGLTAGFLGCKEPETPTPNVSSNATPFFANFLFVNASPDAPALSGYVNNLKTGGDVLKAHIVPFNSLLPGLADR
jgi:hypothetical protein